MASPAERAAELIALLDLRPHPEGGHYREVFRSARSIDPLDGRARRAALTHIYYLLAAGQHSRWHRVSSDEAWHFYEGEPLELLWLAEDGAECRRTLLGPAAAATRPTCVVPAGCWQAARLAGAGRYALIGCTVAPGFDFADFAFMAADEPAAARLRERDAELAALL